MNIVLATRNAGKVHELNELFAPHGHTLISLGQAGFPDTLELPESGETFRDNARSKADAAWERLGGFVLAEDSGLEVDALGGAPGVRSARYSGVQGSAAERDRANNQKLLQELQGVPASRRSARFRCTVVLREPDGTRRETVGVCEGKIRETPRGQAGFGYDPIFQPHGFLRSLAELSTEEKNRISHRGQALRALLELLGSVTRAT